MPLWVRFEFGGDVGWRHTQRRDAGIGIGPTATPSEPRQLVCLWNNIHAMVEKTNQEISEEPLWFLKPPSDFPEIRETIHHPAVNHGPATYEGDMGF